MKLITHETQISGHLLSYLINDDDSGISADEKSLCDQYVNDMLEDYKSIDFSLNDEDSSFDQCDITQLMSDVYDVAVILRK